MSLFNIGRLGRGRLMNWDEIIEALAALAAEGYNGDVEVNHSKADDLLIEALRLAVHHAPTAERAERVAYAYRQIPKWYA